MSDRLLIGLDGGGTSTSAWLTDDQGVILGRGLAGPSNQKVVGRETAFQTIEQARAEAFRDAVLEPRPVAVACLGIAGFGRPEDQSALHAHCQKHQWGDRLICAGDVELVLAAGTDESWGIALISGTGSMAFGRDPRGMCLRAGGWGPLFGDEGSAYAVAIAAIRLVSQRADGRRPAPCPDHLTETLLQTIGARSPTDLIRILYEPDWDRPRLASLAPKLVASAVKDREAATLLIDRPARELADAVWAVASRLGLLDRKPPLALAGGFLLACAPIREAMQRELAPLAPQVREVPEPVVGAIALARRALT